jgi:hypothetical protein
MWHSISCWWKYQLWVNINEKQTPTKGQTESKWKRCAIMFCVHVRNTSTQTLNVMQEANGEGSKTHARESVVNVYWISWIKVSVNTATVIIWYNCHMISWIANTLLIWTCSLAHWVRDETSVMPLNFQIVNAHSHGVPSHCVSFWRTYIITVGESWTSHNNLATKQSSWWKTTSCLTPRKARNVEKMADFFNHLGKLYQHAVPQHFTVGPY